MAIADPGAAPKALNLHNTASVGLISLTGTASPAPAASNMAVPLIGNDELVVPTPNPNALAVRVIQGGSSPSGTTLGLPTATAATTGAESALSTERPTWLEPVADAFGKVARLGSGWDTYGAAPLHRPTLLAALTFLAHHLDATSPAPAVVPLPDGGIQLEWHRAGVDVELTFDAGGAVDLYFADLAADEEWEGPAAGGFRRLNLARRLHDAAT
jgi:hypothetical protein